MLFVLSNTRVVNSRFFKRQNVVWRRRQTTDGVVFTTRETVDLGGLVVHKKTSPPQEYAPSKLFISLLKACDHLDEPEATAWDLSQTVEQKLTARLEADFTISTTVIARIVIETLKNYDTTAYVKYAAFQPDIVSPRRLTFALK